MARTTWDMLADCIVHQPDMPVHGPGEEPVPHEPHPETRPGEFEIYAPNLVLWNGRAHITVLMLKEA